ncbi:SAM-dependent methyltransferase [Kroppenstedtia pulmonis]|uniref:SAM-dependent methyltransferase n=1 Tax=Kroppenstedtia pulmonis TaxID=1380685 RepID=A0A7D3XNA5_9BACL|nr:SAM-dependent methyltransferase [Kroppenstedtia pulmonis]QKG84789.1 SAM-dependent methyltransferase [Kroppenstedtia pulmonis]
MNPLLQQIIREIRRSPGHRISFRHYMELALYHPRWGYYRQERPKIGRQGDYYTSSYVGEGFGLLMSRVLLDMSRTFSPSSSWAVVEMGAGEGRLAEQILKGLASQGVKEEKFRYYLVETSPYHQALQRTRLAKLPYQRFWTDTLHAIPGDIPSILVSNELVDAFPVHRVRMTREGLKEIYVTWDADANRLKEEEGPVSCSELLDYFEEMDWTLEEGMSTEVNLAAHRWMKDVGEWLKTGYVITVDYGGTMEELASPARRDGTLRCYQGHRLHTDWYREPGEADLTSDVNFTALQRWGKEVGLQPLLFTSQARFLIRAGILDELRDHTNPDPFSPEAKRNRGLRQLILPGEMGDAFQVLVQKKNVNPGGLSLLSAPWD